MKLQVGERYRMRNGKIVDDLIEGIDRNYPFISRKRQYSWTEKGIRWIDSKEKRITDTDIIEHIPKEKEMKEPMVRINRKQENFDGSDFKSIIEVTLSEAIRLGEEAQRIKAESEIRPGDYFFDKQHSHISQCLYIERDRVYYKEEPIREWFWTDSCVKIIDPTKPLNEIYEGMK